MRPSVRLRLSWMARNCVTTGRRSFFGIKRAWIINIVDSFEGYIYQGN